MRCFRARVTPGILSFLFAALLFGYPASVLADALDYSFTYQGRLLLDGDPANTPISRLTFNIYDVETGGTPVNGSTPVPAGNSSDLVTDGLFAAKLNFDAAVFTTGEKRWIQMIYTDPANPTSPVVFSRQEMTAGPQSSYSIKAGDAASAANWTGATVGSAATARTTLGLGTAATAATATLSGTSNQVTVTGSGSVVGSGLTLSLPQNIHTGASPTFAGATLGTLTVDTSTLVTDATNNRVGVNAASPAYTLDVNGDVHATTNKGVMLDTADRPIITRAWDAFTSGDYSGAGRWGLFMEPSRLTLGFPNTSNKGLNVVSYNADSSIAAYLMSVLQNGKVGIGVSSPSDNLDILGDSLAIRTASPSGGAWTYLKVLGGSTGRSMFQFGSVGTPGDCQISYANNDHNFSLDTHSTLRTLIDDWSMTFYHKSTNNPSEYAGAFIVNQSGSTHSSNTTVTSNATWDGSHFHYAHSTGYSNPFWFMTMDSGASDDVTFYRGEPVDEDPAYIDQVINKKLRLDNTGSLYFFADGGNVASDSNTASDQAKLYAKSVSGTVSLFAQDSSGSRTQLSSHADPRHFALTTADKTTQSTDTLATSFSDPTVTIPWSFHHSNALIGKGAVVDMSKVVSWVQEKMIAEQGEDAGRAVYIYDLPAGETVSEEDYLNQAAEKALDEAIRKLCNVEVQIGADGLIPAEAWEEVPTMEEQEVTETVTEKKIDWATTKLVEVQRQVTKKVKVATGQTERHLKNGYTLVNGKIYRPATANDVDVSTIPDFQVPEWVSQRVDADKALKSKKTAMTFKDRLTREVAILCSKPSLIPGKPAEAVAMGSK